MQIRQEKLENGDLQMIFTLDEYDQLCLEHDLVDIVEWYKTGPTQQKIYNCRSRMIQENKEKLMQSPEFLKKTVAEVNAIFSDEIAMVREIKSMPGYKNRAQREAELSSKMI